MAAECSRPTRRHVLRVLGAGALTLGPLCVGAPDSAAAESKDPRSHWGYDGDGGPERWGRLQPDFKVCELGMEQTPIDLEGPVRAELGGVDVAFNDMPLRIVNNGHTIQVYCAPGSRTRINGAVFDLLQFHFHNPSEHVPSRRRFDLECHFVHRPRPATSPSSASLSGPAP